MKVAIITITYGQNYGNRLQNYALQTLLENLNYTAETVYLVTHKNGYKTSAWYRMIVWFVKKILHKSYYGFKSNRLRKKRFKNFDDKYIKFSRYKISDKTMRAKIAEEYDYFICGSDQVWNPNIQVVNENIKCHLAYFARPEQRIAYAASFGTYKVQKETMDLFSHELKKFKAIGVREKVGERIIKECCGRDDICTVLDPTMMLTADQWQTIAKKPDFVSNERFILTYFLGEENNRLCEYIERVAEIYDSKVVRLNIEFLSDDKVKNIDQFCTSPDEFIWLVKHSQCILTDSFHASVFSLLFNKPFCVFDRKVAKEEYEMGSRIDTLLGYFGLEDFKDDINNPTKIPKSYNHTLIDDTLKVKREESIAFLKNALNQNA